MPYSFGTKLIVNKYLITFDESFFRMWRRWQTFWIITYLVISAQLWNYLRSTSLKTVVWGVGFRVFVSWKAAQYQTKPLFNSFSCWIIRKVLLVKLGNKGNFLIHMFIFIRYLIVSLKRTKAFKTGYIYIYITQCINFFRNENLNLHLVKYFLITCLKLPGQLQPNFTKHMASTHDHQPRWPQQTPLKYLIRNYRNF